jgi:hypothetical protein
MYQPFARPMRKRPAYRPERLVVAIMITFAAQQRRDAVQRQGRRPRRVAAKPAVEELRKAPRVMREEMSC